jgi:hypothetical protein
LAAARGHREIADGLGAAVPDLEQHILRERFDAVRACRGRHERKDLGHIRGRERA